MWGFCSDIRLLFYFVFHFQFLSTLRFRGVGLTFFFLGWAMGGLAERGAEASQLAIQGPRLDMGLEGKLEESAVGPWGQLEYFSATLVAPKDLLQATMPSSFRTTWVFEGYTLESLANFFKGLDLPSALESKLLDQALWEKQGRSITVNVPRETVRDLPPMPRKKIAEELAKFSVNRHHVEPELIFGENAHEWLEDFEISESVLQFVDFATYVRGSFKVFADIPEALAMCQSDAERVRLMAGFSRTTTLMAKVRLRSGSPEALNDYWGTGPRRKSTLPLLESLFRVKGLNLIDILHLLPAQIRKILFTFPDPLSTRSGYLPDCHWSSLNFFNAEPLESLADPVNATAYVMEHFEKVAPPYRLGDVLFFTDPQTQNAYHSCAYVADNIVFTKNGRSPLQPWVLMTLEEVKKLYDLHFNIEVTGYRRKVD